jgi:hypothetical protein
MHAFERLPELWAELADSESNYHTHAMAVAEQDGVAAFRITL